MNDVSIIIRTADQTRKAEATIPRSNSGAEVLQAAVQKWSLPTDTDYQLVNASNGKSFTPTTLLTEEMVKSGDVLEVQPVLVAGDQI